MEHARKMALVDPRLLDTLRSPPPPLATDTLGRKVQALDDEMKTILDRTDLDDWTKVTLYNQVLQRYNVLADKRIKEPLRVVTVNESEVASESGSAGAVRAPISGLEAHRLGHRSQDHAGQGQPFDGTSQERCRVDRSRRTDTRGRAGCRK